MKATRPYSFKRDVNAPFPFLGKTGDELRLCGDQDCPDENWIQVFNETTGEKLLVVNFDFERTNVFGNNDLLSSPWINDMAIKLIRKRKNEVKNTMVLLEASLREEKKHMVKELVRLGNNQATIDSCIELLQAVTNSDLMFFNDFSSNLNKVRAIGRAIDALNAL